MSDETLDRTVDVFKALAHPVRLRVLAMLRDGELCVCQLTAVLRLAPSTVSAHLAELRRAGLLAERKQGRWVHYRLSLEPPATAKVLAELWERVGTDPEVRADARLLKSLKRVSLETLCCAKLDLGKLGLIATPRRSEGPA